MPARLSDDAIVRLVNESLAMEAEAAINADALGFMARAMVQATMPHRRVDGNEFERRNGGFTLTMLAPTRVGLPYGTIPRLLLAWLTTEAVQTRSRELELGDSLSSFMHELDMVPTGGRWGSIRRLKEQTRRLFNATVSLTYDGRNHAVDEGFRVADRSHLWWEPKNPEQATLWRSTVTLSETFYNEVITRPVPIDLRALHALKKSPLALDLYCWMTYRLSYLDRQAIIPWPALAAQFGSDYKRVRDFRAAFIAELRKVEVIYPEARVTPTEPGLVLLPSRPHIPKLPRPVPK